MPLAQPQEFEQLCLQLVSPGPVQRVRAPGRPGPSSVHHLSRLSLSAPMTQQPPTGQAQQSWPLAPKNLSRSQAISRSSSLTPLMSTPMAPVTCLVMLVHAIVPEPASPAHKAQTKTTQRTFYSPRRTTEEHLLSTVMGQWAKSRTSTLLGDHPTRRRNILWD